MYPGKKIKVAVFDTGVSRHEDLKIKNGISFVDYTKKYDDDNGHGTHVAGTIAATDNKVGIVGVAPEVDVYAVKVLDKNGNGNYSDIIAGIEWAIDNNMDIINMSFGGCIYSRALHEAIQQAVNAGIVIVAAAGNKTYGLMYPAMYPEVVAVGAIDENLQIATFSSRGPELDIVAPGVSILSTMNDGKYSVASGTSMAAPHVSGAFAGLKSKNPSASSDELISTILDTATPMEDKSMYGHGLLDLPRAIGISDTPLVPIVPDIDEPKEELEEIVELIFDENEKKERKAKYEQLLEGNYKSGELLVRFQELFGNGFTKQYISENYQEIFGLDEGEIDEGVLGLLTREGSRSIMPDEANIQINWRNNTVDTLSVQEYNVSVEDSIFIESEDFDNYQDEGCNQILSNITNVISTGTDIRHDGNSDSVNMIDANTSENEGALSDASLDMAADQGVFKQWDKEYVKTATMAENDSVISSYPLPTVSLVSKTTNSVTLDLWFSDNNCPHNSLQVYDFSTEPRGLTTLLGGVNGTQLTSSRVKVSNLKHGNTYLFFVFNWSGGNNPLRVKLDIPSETLVAYSRNNMNFLLDRVLVDALGTVRANNFLAKTDSAYVHMHELFGGDKPFGGIKMQFNNTRTLPLYLEGQSGHPILWQTYTPDPYIEVALDVAYKMNRVNADTAEVPIHEIAHNFDNWKWSFEGEALAILGIYYYYAMTNERMAEGCESSEKAWTGKQYKTYIKERAWRHLDHVNYDLAMSRGHYSPYSLGYTLANIADTIGWKPFKDTFRFIGLLDTSQVPKTSIGKFNLFMTKLRDYSGKDVIAMLTMQEKSIYGNYLGGTIAYSSVIPPAEVFVPNSIKNENLPAGEYKIYSVTSKITGKYSIITGPFGGKGAANDTVLELYSDEALKNRLAINDNFDDTVFSRIDYTLNANTTYYIKLRHASSNVGVNARISVVDEVPQSVLLNLNSYKDVSLSAGKYSLYRFRPTVSQKYSIYTGPFGGTGPANDTFLGLYSDAAMRYCFASNNDSGGTVFSKIDRDLEAGITYYIRLHHNDTTKGAVHARISITPATVAIPNNSYPLKWPTDSTEVTQWFGKVHEATSIRYQGLDIQGNSGSDVYSISAGVVAYKGFDNYYGNSVVIDYKYDNVFMQARYAHLSAASPLTVGQTVSRGTRVGGMGSSGSTFGGAVLTMEISRSTNGQICNLNGSNTVKVNPQDYFAEPPSDSDYLTRTTAVSVPLGFATASFGDVESEFFWGDSNDPDVRYNRNLDLGKGEVYLRKEILRTVQRNDFLITSDTLETRGILTWDANSRVATVKLNGRTAQFSQVIGNARIVNERMVVTRESLWHAFVGNIYNYPEGGTWVPRVPHPVGVVADIYMPKKDAEKVYQSMMKVDLIEYCIKYVVNYGFASTVVYYANAAGIPAWLAEVVLTMVFVNNALQEIAEIRQFGEMVALCKSDGYIVLTVWHTMQGTRPYRLEYKCEDIIRDRYLYTGIFYPSVFNGSNIVPLPPGMAMQP